MLFDNVLIPWKYVFHIGNPDHAKLYPQRVFDWVHYYALVRQAVRAELLAGPRDPDVRASRHCQDRGRAGAARARSSGSSRSTYAHVLASEDKGFYTPGGLYKPDIQLFNWGRVYFLQHFGAMVDELIDLCGRSAVMFPTEKQWQNPQMRPWFERLNKGAAGEPYDRIKIARVIRDLYLTDWGGRLFMFENFNGTPLQTLLSLTMKRAEFTGAGPFAAFARKVCRARTAGRRATEYKTDADYAKAQDAGRAASDRARSPPDKWIGYKPVDSTRTDMAKQRISYVPLEKMDARDARGNGALPARGHAAAGKLGGARACAGVFWFFANSWRDIFRNGVLDHAIKELCRLYVSRSVQCEYCGNQRSVKVDGERRGDRRSRYGPAELRKIHQVTTSARRRRWPMPRRSPGTSTPTTRSGTACTAVSASRSWSSSAA